MLHLKNLIQAIIASQPTNKKKGNTQKKSVKRVEAATLPSNITAPSTAIYKRKKRNETKRKTQQIAYKTLNHRREGN